jgi:uncharacterized protein (TIGR00730 family)
MTGNTDRTISRIAIYAGSKPGRNPAWLAASERLGTLLGENGYDLAYGGGGVGHMGAVVRTALAAGARVKGFIDRAWHNATGSNGPAGVDEVIVESREQRKYDMRQETQASVLMPGGIGSWDEFFDILAWQDEQRYRPPFLKRPIIVLNVEGCHDRLKALIEGGKDDGFLYEESRNLIHFADTPEEVVALLNRYNSQPRPGASASSAPSAAPL